MIGAAAATPAATGATRTSKEAPFLATSNAACPISPRTAPAGANAGTPGTATLASRDIGGREVSARPASDTFPSCSAAIWRACSSAARYSGLPGSGSVAGAPLEPPVTAVARSPSSRMRLKRSKSNVIHEPCRC